MQSSVCKICVSWMLERDGWLRCICGYATKITKRIIKPVGGHHMIDDTFNGDPTSSCPADRGNGSDPIDYKKRPKKPKSKLPIT